MGTLHFVCCPSWNKTSQCCLKHLSSETRLFILCYKLAVFLQHMQIFCSYENIVIELWKTRTFSISPLSFLRTLTIKLTHLCLSLFFKLYLFYVHEHFVNMYVFACCVHLLLREASRGRQMPWDWSYRGLWTAMWVLGINSGSPEEQPMLLTFQPPSQHNFVLYCVRMFEIVV